MKLISIFTYCPSCFSYLNGSQKYINPNLDSKWINVCSIFIMWTGSSMIELSKLIYNYKELHYRFIYFGTHKLKCEWVLNIGHAPQCIWEYFCTQLSRYLLRLSVKTSLIRLCRILIKQSANTIENLWLIKNFKGGCCDKMWFFWIL